jgi:hypothetical protein
MANVTVKENHLTYGGVAYFRGHADAVHFGDIGEKRTPLTSQNYLEVKDRLPADKLDGVRATVVEIDTGTLSKAAFPLKVSAIVPVSGVPVPIQFDGEAAFTKLKAYDLKLVKFSILTNDLVDAVNRSPKKRQYLIDWGNDARIAHQVFIVMDAEVATKFDNNVAVNLAVGVEDVVQATVGGSGSASGGTTVKFADGVCFAYLLAKPEWNAKQKKNITAMTDANDDQWSLN